VASLKEIIEWSMITMISIRSEGFPAGQIRGATIPGWQWSM
jgi:hypothetical protein